MFQHLKPLIRSWMGSSMRPVCDVPGSPLPLPGNEHAQPSLTSRLIQRSSTMDVHSIATGETQSINHEVMSFLEATNRQYDAHGFDATSFQANSPQHSTEFQPGTGMDHSPKRLNRALTAWTRFGNKVDREMDDIQIGLDMSEKHLPDSKTLELLTFERISETMPNASTEMVEYIINRAPKTFLITLSAVHEPYGPVAMQNFFDHDFTDQELPIKNLTTMGKTSQRPRCCRTWDEDDEDCDDDIGPQLRSVTDDADAQPPCSHNRAIDAFHDHHIWDRRRFNAFYKMQWSFVVQKFSLEQFEYPSIESRRLLPFIIRKKEPVEKAGHFSEVTQASMLADHFVTGVCSEQEPSSSRCKWDLHHDEFGHISVAIKTLKDLKEPDFDLKKEWRREAEAHKELNELNHPHIIKGLAAFRQKGQYHLLLEWANGGSLRSFWHSHRKPILTKELIREILYQLKGLADALNHMHNKQVVHSRSISPNRRESGNSLVDEPGIKIFRDRLNVDSQSADRRRSVHFDAIPDIVIDEPVATAHNPTIIIEDETSKEMPMHNVRTNENWRHGDVKPENILRFVNPGELIGTLKLADLGRAKRHMNVTSKRPDVEIDNWHTKDYEPPDIFIHGDSRSMSRLYDIWSLGCVYFEAISWMLYGVQELRRFEETTRKTRTEGTPYWSRSGRRSAVVSPMVKLWMSHILRYDPECNPKESSVISDLLRLVKDRMLVVDLPDDSDLTVGGRRTNAEDLCVALENIVRKAKQNDTYLFTARDRSKVKAPPTGQVALDKLRAEDVVAGGEKSLLPVPGGSNMNLTSAIRRNQYTHAMNADWTVENDDDFASKTIELLQDEFGPELTRLLPTSPQYCEVCLEMDLRNLEDVPTRRLLEIKRSADLCCQLCKLVHRVARGAGFSDHEEIALDLKEGRMRINRKDHVSLRLCRTPESRDLAHPAVPYIPVGLARLPDSKSQEQTAMLAEWVEDCETRHPECEPKSNVWYTPRRLIDVGHGSVESKHWKIVESKKLRDTRYVAFSHPWGNPQDHDHFKLTKRNMAKFQNKTPDQELPANFQDAVMVTRKLSIRYLWIDSLCIIQEDGADKGDFHEEADRMQDIFSSAYCVIAASSAEGMSSGFLNRRRQTTAVLLPQKGLANGGVSVSDVLNDFEKDVVQSHLNSRGWALQERALARRTVFFTNNQLYFECSQGIRCETLTKLRSKKASFLGDSDFPHYGMKGQPLGAQLYLFTGLYEDYSHRSFSHLPDRPVAISGLEQRLTKYFSGKSAAGVFERQRERWLLWARNVNSSPALHRIDFQMRSGSVATSTGDDAGRMNHPPSWSWMAHNGGVVFLQPPVRRTTWNQKIKLRLTGSAESSWLYNTSERPSMRAPVHGFSIPADADFDECSLTYDAGYSPAYHHVRKCIIVGTVGEAGQQGTQHWILLVQPKKDLLTGSTVYERIGAGYLPNRFLLSEEYEDEVAIE